MTTRLDRIYQEAIENEELLEGLIDRKGLEALIRVARAAHRLDVAIRTDFHKAVTERDNLSADLAPLLEEV
jgi:hypothetical protein